MALALLVVCASCQKQELAPAAQSIRLVRVQTASLQSHPRLLHYIGSTGSQSIKKYGFKVPGRIARIFVAKGQHITRGQKLAQLDGKDIGFALQAARLRFKKAKDAYDDAEKFYHKVKTLHKKGVSSQMDFDKAKLQYDMAQAAQNQARVDLDYKQSMQGDSSMYADIDGFVVEVLNKVGEFVAGGYPVVVVRNEHQVVKVGVSQRDIKLISLGTKVQLDVDGEKGQGEVSNIAQIPDRLSRTYEVEVSLSDSLALKKFYIGAISRVAFDLGLVKGIWLPVSALLTDGADYVFVDEQGRARRKNVELVESENLRVLVRGLQVGAQVIVEGMKNLKEGDRVRLAADADQGPQNEALNAKKQP